MTSNVQNTIQNHSTYKEMGKCDSFSKKDNPQNPNLEDPDVRIVHKDVKIQRNKGNRFMIIGGRGRNHRKIETMKRRTRCKYNN